MKHTSREIVSRRSQMNLEPPRSGGRLGAGRACPRTGRARSPADTGRTAASADRRRRDTTPRRALHHASLARDQQHVVGQRLGKHLRQRLRIVRAGQRNAAGAREPERDLRQPAVAGDADEIDRQERRAVDGIVVVLERDESPLDDQTEQAQHAELIRRAHDQPAARLENPCQLAAECTRALEMLDRLERRDDVGGRRSARESLAVEIGAMERRVGGQARMAHDVDADVVGRQVARELEESADAAADVDEDAARAPGAQQGRGGAIDRDVARALAFSPRSTAASIVMPPVSIGHADLAASKRLRERDARFAAGRPRVRSAPRHGPARGRPAAPRSPASSTSSPRTPRQRVEVAGRHEATAVVGDDLRRAAGIGGHDRARPTGAPRRRPRRTAQDLHSVGQKDRLPASAAARHAVRRETAPAARVRVVATSCRSSARYRCSCGPLRARRRSTASTRPSCRRRPSARTQVEMPFPRFEPARAQDARRLPDRLQDPAGGSARARRSRRAGPSPEDG